jgi:hypothetical protein
MLNVKWKVAQYNVHEQTVEWCQVFISMHANRNGKCKLIKINTLYYDHFTSSIFYIFYLRILQVTNIKHFPC